MFSSGFLVLIRCEPIFFSPTFQTNSLFITRRTRNLVHSYSPTKYISINLSKFGDKVVSLNVESDAVSVDYVLSDLSVISDPPSLKRLPEFETKIKLDSNFINTFIKGKSALSDVDMFTILKNKSGECEVIIGYSSTNTNRVNIPVSCDECNIDTPITFNANLFKEVLVANKECTSAVLHVSSEGLAKVNFKVDDYDSTYHIVATQDVD